MDKLVSNWLNIDSVPESYILSPERRPGTCLVPSCRMIPVIDLSGENGQDRIGIVKEIIKASQEFGFFQVINHGISESAIKDMMGVAEEFFQMPAEDLASMYIEDHKQISGVLTGAFNGKQGNYWRDSLRHPSYPLDINRHFWPSKPTKYREIAESYTLEVRKLAMRLMELICEGLGTDSSYSEDTLCYGQAMAINHYPRCPNPSLTMGLPKHCDPNSLTILLQGDVPGLQVLKDGGWIAVEPLPNAFVINLGHQLQIISNGKLKSAEHRAVTNSSVTRTTIATFFHPSKEYIVQPDQKLVDEFNPPMFKTFKYHEFFDSYLALGGDSEKTLQHFKF